MTLALDESFAWCRSLTRATARNFYYAFRTLPPRPLRDTCALYAFMRIADDLGDDESSSVGVRRERLASWRRALHAALDGGPPAHPCLPALADVVRRHRIPPTYLDDVLVGIESDLAFRPFDTFEELSRYCYHVAGAVGACCIHVWGMRDERAVDVAIVCGRAFQLTNILRDVGEDARNGRVYLPREDLARFDCTTRDLLAERPVDRVRELVRFEAGRARADYEAAGELFDLVTPPAKPILSAMIRIYRGLLEEIERRNFDVLSRRVRLSSARKIWISLDTMVREWWSGDARVAR